MQYVFALFLALWLSSTPSHAENGLDRGGGGEGAAEFVTAAREILSYLERWRDAGTLEPELAAINLNGLRRAIDGTLVAPVTPLRIRINLCTYHPDVAEVQQCPPRRDGREPRRIMRMRVTAAQSASTHTIELDEERWQSWGNDVTRYMIVLHEYRGTQTLEDRNYAQSSVFLLHLARERDAERFRQELRGRLTTASEGFRPLIIPQYGALATMIETIQSTEEYRRCAEAPHGTDQNAVMERVSRCIGMARWMRRLGAGIDAAVRRAESGGPRIRAEQAQTEFETWAATLPADQRAYAQHLLQDLIAEENRAASAIATLTATFIGMFDVACPQRDTAEATVCAIDTTARFVNQDIPAATAEELGRYDAVAEQIFARADRFVVR